MPCLEAVLQETLHAETEIHKTMLGCIGAFNEAILQFDQIGAFLTKEEYNVGMNLVKRFFSLYADLHHWAESQDRKLFHVTFKFHACLHMFMGTKYMNYRFHSNFRGEDYVGRISGLCSLLWSEGQQAPHQAHAKVQNTFPPPNDKAWLQPHA